MAFALSACADGGPPHSLTAEQVEGLRVRQVFVEVADDAPFKWHGGEARYVAMQGCDPTAPTTDGDERLRGEAVCDRGDLMARPEARAWTRDKAAEEVQGAVEEALVAELIGDRATDAKVVVQGLSTAGTGAFALTGGTHALLASFELLDAESGETLARYPDLPVEISEGGLVGLAVQGARGDPVPRLSEVYAAKLRDWLLEPGRQPPGRGTPVATAR